MYTRVSIPSHLKGPATGIAFDTPKKQSTEKINKTISILPHTLSSLEDAADTFHASTTGGLPTMNTVLNDTRCYDTAGPLHFHHTRPPVYDRTKSPQPTPLLARDKSPYTQAATRVQYLYCV